MINDEEQYLNLIKNILTNGHIKEDRTKIGTKSVFGVTLRFNLKNNQLPLFTTKRVYWKSILHELLWFISGSTNAKELSAKGVGIWEGNSSSEFLKRNGFENRLEGDLGPIYGFQWRHYGAEYIDMNTNYQGKGIDQLNEVINKIKSNPNDRRIILTAWNPVDIPKMALPPCHCFVQFNVTENGLSCLLFQRSGDVGLGIPFNVASYAFLTHIIAKLTGLEAYELIHVIGDAHIYLNHIDALTIQSTRSPRNFPKVKINSKSSIDDFTIDDFEVCNYDPHPSIKMKLAI